LINSEAACIFTLAWVGRFSVHARPGLRLVAYLRPGSGLGECDGRYQGDQPSAIKNICVDTTSWNQVWARGSRL